MKRDDYMKLVAGANASIDAVRAAIGSPHHHYTPSGGLSTHECTKDDPCAHCALSKITPKSSDTGKILKKYATNVCTAVDRAIAKMKTPVTREVTQ